MKQNQQYTIHLKTQEKQELEKLILSPKETKKREFRRAQVLLMADDQQSNKAIARETGLSEQAIINIKKRYCSEGLCLKDKPRSGQPPKLDQTAQITLKRLASGPPPKGQKTWSLRTLAEKMIELNLVCSISKESIRNYLKNESGR
ncbi:hypothetical protein COW36_21790 [bacterium (Candidatus Blackallbacteria) CG17_big_fil_post_rev_8_21_14_2_50_48_46]|uniref:Helix-turn-helix domain-containing protein n=1 Tax=bacterium (Candidatus Blackallbacteria) CG17_big_fil_post_rev_8_21_14_2_50_48_46 TaxID=2014261 RepID=A0A2M7FYI0_9BACT|nr:MAG: hypothetical protein COW64_11070 [bacterium (Candidatus Blackallbacteria) CG18_big_fil_WC_8_21_14_2_50_49_26]PIW14402.1 MAG: hypothetical protein COW36_21790 [bacterium (Candidatus Blackallbacteria) CG17_big_fil_post_rev_8_21_14_2_50_48_46]PIW46909.1 MAG: hypothetical protein COW20_14205 [bacterium (Candidatus Blackallbacteria) CG13_big_fil_rev_8_21_14_2_50_49_14]